MAVEVGAIKASLTLEIGKFKDGIRRAKRELEEIKAGADKTTRSFEGLATALTALGASTALVGLVRTIKSLTDEANELSASLTGLSEVAKALGEDVKEATGLAEELASRGFMSIAEAATAVKTALSAGLNLEETKNLINATADAAAYNREAHLSWGEAIVQVMRGIKSGNSELTDAAGITTNLSVMYDRYAQSIGTSAAKLTEAQKVQAAYNGIMAESALYAGNADTALQGYTGTQAAFNATLQTARAELGEAFLPIVQRITETLTPLIVRFTEWASANKEIVAGLAAAGVAVTGFIATLTTLATVIGVVSMAAKSLQLSLGWIGALTLAIGSAAAIFTSYKVSVEEAAEAQRQFNELVEKPAMERTVADVQAMQAQLAELNPLLDERNKLMMEYNEIMAAAERGEGSKENTDRAFELADAINALDKELEAMGFTAEEAEAAVKTLNDEINKSTPALAEMERQELAALATKVDHIDRVVELRRQYDELTKTEKLTEAQKSQLASVVEELTREYPSLIAQLDEENVWHIKNREALDELIQAEKDSLEIAAQKSKERTEIRIKETEAALKLARMQIEALNAAQGINFTETKIGKRLPSDLSKFIDVAGDYVLSGMSRMVQSQANEHIARLNQLERDLQSITVGAFDQFRRGNGNEPPAPDKPKKSGSGNKTKTTREKTAAELQQEAYRASLAYIDYMRNVGKMSEEQEIAALERLLKRYQKNTEIRRDAEVRIYRIREQLEADAEKRAEEARKKAEKDAKDAAKKAEEAARARFDASAEWIDAQERKMTEAYASEREIAQMQLEAWTRVRNRYEKDSEYYKRADIEMYNARMRLRKLDEQAAKEAADAEKKAADERAKLAKEATSALVKEIDKQRKAELDALNQRRKAIEEFYADQTEAIDEGERLRERQKLEEEAQKYRYATSQRGQEQYLELMERIRQMDIEDQKRNLAKERDEKLDALDRQKNDIETWYNDIRETIEAFSGDFISIYKLTEDERFNAFVTTNEKIKAELERFKAEYDAIYSGVTTPSNVGQSNQNASIIAQMQANSQAWKSASAAERARLEAENQRLGASLGATLDRKTGRWMLGGLPLYHTGGRVGEFNFRTGDRLMPDEIAAILRRDEYVFTPQQLESLIGTRVAQPAVNVHIEKVMEVNDATFEDGIDLRALGRDAGDTAAAVIRTQFTGGGGR